MVLEGIHLCRNSVFPFPIPILCSKFGWQHKLSRDKHKKKSGLRLQKQFLNFSLGWPSSVKGGSLRAMVGNSTVQPVQ